MAVISGNPLVLLAGIGLLAAVAQWSAWRLKLPAILPLLVFGIVVGPVTGVLDPDALFGDLLFPIVSLSVAVILFEGALTLKISELREIGTTVRNLVTIGALITWLVTSVTVHLSLGFDFDLAMLFGAMVVVTGPTVIVPMLRTVRPVRRVANILRWEGIVIDPIGALLAVLAFNYVLASQKTEALDDIFALFLMVVAIGSVIGLIFGFGLALILRKDWLPEYLRSPFTLLMVFVAFAGAEMAEHESGLLAVTIFGMVLANRPGVEVHDILDFKESLSVLLISGLFILLAARVDFEGLVAIGWPAALVVAVIILVARPLAVFVSTIGSELSINERLLIAWIGPRGIVCAAVAAIFALRLEQVGAEGASLLVPLAFSVIITTVVLQSLTARRLAGLLGVRDPAPAGYLIIGSGQVAR
ncbi:MAG: sodium:proton antiporter, partial [Gammaproteobacteria bacterium]|nr:sodium:proton antiporter [Gammaproteobacteria bacterium]